jgi:hypothetical protein
MSKIARAKLVEAVNLKGKMLSDIAADEKTLRLSVKDGMLLVDLRDAPDMLVPLYNVRALTLATSSPWPEDVKPAPVKK